MNAPQQLTTEQATAFSEGDEWKSWPAEKLALFQMQQGKLCVPLSALHEAVEKALGRPVCMQEFGMNRAGLLAELEGKATPPSMEEIINMLARTGRPVVVVQTGSKA